jgi:3-deoxy-manno-octulosonate cytidylyltransferase (CMP-KDO synthetase)
MTIYKIVPFRLQSQRFPNKPLCVIFGKTLIENGLDIAHSVSRGKTILTGPEEDFLEVKEKVPGLHKRDFIFIPTSGECKSATERVMELSRELKGDLFISIPMDEPSIIPGELERGLVFSLQHNPDVLTLYCDFFCEEDARSTLSAKIVTDNHGRILYMSRSVIPLRKNGTIQLSMLKKNVGVFYFRSSFLQALEEHREVQTSLDTYEGLEQLRWLELGYSIYVQKIKHYGFGIDIPDQVEQLEKRITCLPPHRK